ncbi:MAG: Cytidine deaminase [Holosporales bacterium]
MPHDLLVEKAKQAFLNARAIYSGFQVGAAVLLEDGSIFEGFNVEADSSALSICAERVAVVHAMLYSRSKIKKIAIVADTESFVSPCGVCRQFLSEFSSLTVIMANLKGDQKVMTIKDLLPFHFQRRSKKNQ